MHRGTITRLTLVTLTLAGVLAHALPAAASDEAPAAPEPALVQPAPPAAPDLSGASMSAAAVGAGIGFAAAALPSALVWGVGVLMRGFVPGPGPAFWAVYGVVALTTPALLVVLPALGAGLAARGAAAAITDEEGANVVGLGAGLGTAGLAVAGGLGGAIVASSFVVLSSGDFGSSTQVAAMTLGAPAALVGAGVGAAFGAAVGAAASAHALTVPTE